MIQSNISAFIAIFVVAVSFGTTFKSVDGIELYCPDINDFRVQNNLAAVVLRDGGWTMSGSSSFVTTKAAFNMLGGWVEFDADFSEVPTGVNANLYSIFPANIADAIKGFQGNWGERPSDYCDGQGDRGDGTDDSIEGLTFCPEHDFIESNGDCGGATALHTVKGRGAGRCNAWGCISKFSYNSQPKISMRITYDTDGTFRTQVNGNTIPSSAWNPSLNQGSNDDAIMLQTMRTGAVLASSQWVGWVPTISGCSTAPGDITQSSYTISNIRVYGEVVQGPSVRLCSEVAPTPLPTEMPSNPTKNPTKNPTETPTTPTTIGHISPGLKDFGATPPASQLPLQLCEGDCDDDGDCAGGLKCFQRTGLTPVPGCSGSGKTHFDYCIYPELKDFGATPPVMELRIIDGT